MIHKDGIFSKKKKKKKKKKMDISRSFKTSLADRCVYDIVFSGLFVTSTSWSISGGNVSVLNFFCYGEHALFCCVKNQCFQKASFIRIGISTCVLGFQGVNKTSLFLFRIESASSYVSSSSSSSTSAWALSSPTVICTRTELSEHARKL